MNQAKKMDKPSGDTALEKIRRTLSKFSPFKRRRTQSLARDTVSKAMVEDRVGSGESLPAIVTQDCTLLKNWCDIAIMDTDFVKSGEKSMSLPSIIDSKGKAENRLIRPAGRKWKYLLQNYFKEYPYCLNDVRNFQANLHVHCRNLTNFLLYKLFHTVTTFVAIF